MFADTTNILALPLSVVPQVSQNRNGIYSNVGWVVTKDYMGEGGELGVIICSVESFSFTRLKVLEIYFTTL